MAKASKKTRISNEIKKIKKYFSAFNKDELSIIENLIVQAATIWITIEDLNADIDLNGSTRMFTQSHNTPPNECERPAAGLLIKKEKNYISTIKEIKEFYYKLCGVNKSESDGFDEFVKKRN